jgi:hypothetical protein
MAGSAIQKSRNPETDAYPECSAKSCKSLQAWISRISAEIPPTFQRAFLNWECASSNPIGGLLQFGAGLRTPKLANSHAISAKVSARIRENSRFGRQRPETWFDRDCRPTSALSFGPISGLDGTESKIFRSDSAGTDPRTNVRRSIALAGSLRAPPRPPWSASYR